MSVMDKLNSAPLYAICGGIIAFVAVVCVIFMVRAYRQGKALGMDTTKMKRVIVSSATFSVLPSIGILLGLSPLREVSNPLAVAPPFGNRCPPL